jgi:putative DNA-binding protein
MSALARMQHQMQALITGVGPEPPAGTVKELLLPSRTLSAEARLGIYRKSCRLRLLRCLREQLPLLHQALGDELFDGFADQYLALHPPRSYTLERLDAEFVDYLQNERPDRDSQREWWPDWMIDLVRFDQISRAVFHGTGSPVLARFAFPVVDYARAVQRGESPPPPRPRPIEAVIFRHDWRVHFRECSAPNGLPADNQGG